MAPRACADFHRLLVGGLGTSLSASAPQRLHYRGTRLHAIVRGVAVFGGAIGDGADAVLQAEPAAELTQAEADARHARHARAGLLTTDSPDGVLARTCRFALTLAPAPQFDGGRLIFGEVVSGLGVLLELERVPTDAAGAPSGAGARITECGLVADDDAGGAPDGAGGEEAARAGPLDATGARALTEQTVQRVDKAMAEGLALPKRAREAGEAGAAAKRGAPAAGASAVAARWQAPLDELSDDDDGESSVST